MNALTEPELFRDSSAVTASINPAELEAVTAAVDETLALPVLSVTPMDRCSVPCFRVFVPKGSLIASFRRQKGEVKREAKVLDRLWKAGAPVPRILACSDQYLFEEDLGDASLQGALISADAPPRHQLMERAFASLYRVKSAAQKAKIRRSTPCSCADKVWLADFITSPQDLADILNIPAPEVDPRAAIYVLQARASVFVKGGMSLGDACVREDHRVFWMGWRNAGLGAGYEDIGQLITDENWPLQVKASLAMYRRFQLDWTPQAEARLSTFAAIHVCRRLLAICRGQWPAASLETVRKLSRHGADYAARSHLMRSAVPWFEALASETLWREAGFWRSESHEML